MIWQWTSAKKKCNFCVFFNKRVAKNYVRPYNVSLQAYNIFRLNLSFLTFSSLITFVLSKRVFISSYDI
jgi:hypothetical protein